MRFAQEKHTDTGLSDTAADCLRESAVQNGFLEGKLRAGLASAFLLLDAESICVDADTHGGELKSDVKHWIINDQVAV